MQLVFLKMKHFFTKMQDILFTDIRYLLPCAFKWIYHRKIKKDIFLFPLKNSSGRTASLYQHGKWKSKNKDLKDRQSKAILILHGLYSYPLVMLHLAKMAQKANIGPVFSLYVRYDEANPQNHRDLIKQAMDTIEKLSLDRDYSLKGMVLVGHSMGAIEAAHTAFVEKDKRILSVISIAGRLKVVESLLNPCRESLKDTLNKIATGVQLNPNLSLYQIVGRLDWNAPLESTLIRKDKGFYYIVDKGMHFNIIFHKETKEKILEFLKKTL